MVHLLQVAFGVFVAVRKRRRKVHAEDAENYE